MYTCIILYNLNIVTQTTILQEYIFQNIGHIFFYHNTMKYEFPQYKSYKRAREYSRIGSKTLCYVMKTI